MRISRPIHEGLSCPYVIALQDTDMLALGNKVIYRITEFRCDDNPSSAFAVLTERNSPVYFAENRILLRFSYLKQLSDPRQTASNILCLGGFSGNLRKDSSGIHLVALINHDDSVRREGIPCLRLSR